MERLEVYPRGTRLRDVPALFRGAAFAAWQRVDLERQAEEWRREQPLPPVADRAIATKRDNYGM